MKSCNGIKKYLCSRYAINPNAVFVYFANRYLHIIYAGKYRLYGHKLYAPAIYMVKTSTLDNLDKFFSEYRPENI